mgnify:CR=1 FL=1
MADESNSGWGRRQLITGGLVAGAGALFAPGQSAAAAPAADGTGSQGDGAGEDLQVASLPTPEAMPALYPGARAVSVSGSAFFGVDFTSGPASPATFAGKGARVQGGTRLGADLRIPVGSRIVRLDYFGYNDVAGNQSWWLVRRDVTTFASTDVYANVLTGAGATTATRTLDELVLPGFSYETWAESYPGGPYVRGVIAQYLPPVGDFNVVSPKRVYDSRSGVAIAAGEERTVAVDRQLGTGAVVVPAGVRAVALNVTITGTGAAGFLSVRPALTAWDNTSTINWSGPNTTIANGTTTGVSSDLKVVVRCGEGAGVATHFILDVLGYYL